MTTPYKTRFTDGQDNICTVNEVVQTPVGLTVYYENEATKQEYSCLLEAFSERFKEIQND
jgi:hypothetical protein